MSLQVDGVWKAAVWAATPWTQGVWFEGAQPPPPSAEQPYTGPSGGIPAREFRDVIERRFPKVSRETLKLPSKAQKVIEAVALRQVEKLETDEFKRLEELTRELDLRGIEWETRYLEALNVRREALIDAEIAKLLKIKLEDEDALLLVMLAASI